MNVLLISPAFFGYEDAIAETIRSKGHEVDLVDERPSNSAMGKVLVRFFPGIVRRRVNEHFKRILDAAGEKSYDIVLVIKGEVTPTWFLTALRDQHRSANFIYYTFDSLKNSPQILSKLGFFDKLYSFDSSDAARDERFTYKPLFFVNAYRCEGRVRDLDVSFVGTIHGDRYPFTQAACGLVPAEGRFLFYYVPAIWYFQPRKLVSRSFRQIPRAEVKTIPLTRPQVIDVVHRSRAVLDLQRDGQTGLTMRTFEVLASGAGLITANASIAKEPFYNPERILIVPREVTAETSRQISEFISRQPEKGMIPVGFEEHSLSNWVEDFLASSAAQEGTGIQ